MSTIRFKGGERYQRGRGIGGLLRLAKGLFKPLLKPAMESIGRVVKSSAGRAIGNAIKSNTGRAIGKALKNQAIDTAKNLATDVLSGNPLNEGVKREVHNIKNRAALGIQQLNKNQEVICRESKRQSKSKSRGKTKVKANKKVGKWVWFDNPRNE